MKNRYESQVVLWGAMLAALGFAALFVIVATRRAAHPDPLAVHEDEAALGALALARGIALEPPWTCLRTPLQALLGAAWATVEDSTWLGLRLVSIVATFFSSWALSRIAGNLLGPAAALIAAGAFLATFAVGGASFDLAGTQPLALALLLGALLLVNASQLVAGGACAALALLAEPITFVPLALCGAALVKVNGTRGLRFVAPCVAASVALLLFGLGGAMLVPHGLVTRWHPAGQGPVEIYLVPLWGYVPLALVGCTVLLVDARRHLPLLALAFGLVLIGALQPAPAFGHAMLALLAALGLRVLNRRFAGLQRRAVVPRFLLAGLWFAQAGLLAYRPSDHVPTAEQTRNGAELARVIRELDGRVVSDTRRAQALLAARNARASSEHPAALLLAEAAPRAPFTEVLPAFPGGQHAHARAARGFEVLWWHVRPDDAQLTARLQASVRR